VEKVLLAWVFVDHIKPGVSNSTCSLGHMKIYKVSRGPHYNAGRWRNSGGTWTS